MKSMPDLDVAMIKVVPVCEHFFVYLFITFHLQFSNLRIGFPLCVLAFPPLSFDNVHKSRGYFAILKTPCATGIVQGHTSYFI